MKSTKTLNNVKSIMTDKEIIDQEYVEEVFEKAKEYFLEMVQNGVAIDSEMYHVLDPDDFFEIEKSPEVYVGDTLDDIKTLSRMMLDKVPFMDPHFWPFIGLLYYLYHKRE